MALPSPINIEVSFGDAIRAVAEILGRAQVRDDELRDATLLRLRDQLEITWTVITKLENCLLKYYEVIETSELSRTQRLSEHM